MLVFAMIDKRRCGKRNIPVACLFMSPSLLTCVGSLSIATSARASSSLRCSRIQTTRCLRPSTVYEYKCRCIVKQQIGEQKTIVTGEAGITTSGVRLRCFGWVGCFGKWNLLHSVCSGNRLLSIAIRYPIHHAIWDTNCGCF